jgi:hypothetical protein
MSPRPSKTIKWHHGIPSGSWTTLGPRACCGHTPRKRRASSGCWATWVMKISMGSTAMGFRDRHGDMMVGAYQVMGLWYNGIYPLVNKHRPWKSPIFIMETSLPPPMTARVYVNLPEATMGYANIILKKKMKLHLCSETQRRSHEWSLGPGRVCVFAVSTWPLLCWGLPTQENIWFAIA